MKKYTYVFGEGKKRYSQDFENEQDLAENVKLAKKLAAGYGWILIAVREKR